MKFKNDKHRRAVMRKIKVGIIDDKYDIKPKKTTEREKKIVNIIADELEHDQGVERVYLVTPKNNAEYGAFITEDGKEVIVKYKPSNSLQSYRPLIKHELDHAYFMNKLKTDPSSIKKYAQMVNRFKPFTLNLELVKSENDKQKLKGTKYSHEWIDEIHSETGEHIFRKENGLPSLDLKTQTSLYNIPTFNMAIKAYNKLHDNDTQ